VFVEDGEDIKALASSGATSQQSQAQRMVLPLAEGTTLVYSHSENMTTTVATVTPEYAKHHEEMARIRAEADVKVAELTHVAPVRVVTRPLWFLNLSLVGIAGWALHADQSPIAIAAITALTGVEIVRQIKKP
jgi:hypothetical protein